MTRLAILLIFAAACAGCTTGSSSLSTGPVTGNPYFLCRTADYVRHHIDVCSGILR